MADGSAVTACAEACPTNAISFGDLNDKAVKCAPFREQPAYHALEEIGREAQHLLHDEGAQREPPKPDGPCNREAAIREPLILGNKSYKDITDDVVGPIQGHAPIGWKIMITISSVIAVYGVGCILYLYGYGHWCLGIEQNRGLGLGHHQLRLVGRYWTRWNADFCGVAAVPPESGGWPSTVLRRP